MAIKPNNSVIQWLLDSDPSTRWQVMRDLIGALAGTRCPPYAC